MSDIRYTGAITFESFSTIVVSPTLSIWRNLWNDGPALARHAHSYISNALEGTRASF